MSLGGSCVIGIILWTCYFIVVGKRVVVFVIAGGVGGDMDSAGGGMRVLGIQLVNSYRILDISVNCLWWLVTGASFIEQERKLWVWLVLSSAGTVGWVR